MAPDPDDPADEVHSVRVVLPEAVVETEPPLESLPVLGPEHEVHEEAGEPGPLLSQIIDSQLPSPEPNSAPSLLEFALPSAPPSLDDDLQGLPILEPLLEEAEPEAPDSLPPEPEPAGDYRAIYMAEFSLLERDLRIAHARQATGHSLLAFCFDPEPQVIAAVFENTGVGLEHARLAALHHKNPAGLEHVVKRADFLRDARVQRQLLKNSQLTESLLRRILGSKPLREIYKAAIDRDVPERTRVTSRVILRNRFGSSDPEERAGFLISNEARALALLIGQTLDQKTTAILCSRQYTSVLFVQNLARFAACPPLLLAHLLKQPFVRRHVALKKLLLQHPNLPSALKREG
jgi:hypothetical protein